MFPLVGSRQTHLSMSGEPIEWPQVLGRHGRFSRKNKYPLPKRNPILSSSFTGQREREFWIQNSVCHLVCLLSCKGCLGSTELPYIKIEMTTLFKYPHLNILVPPLIPSFPEIYTNGIEIFSIWPWNCTETLACWSFLVIEILSLAEQR